MNPPDENTQADNSKSRLEPPRAAEAPRAAERIPHYMQREMEYQQRLQRELNAGHGFFRTGPITRTHSPDFVVYSPVSGQANTGFLTIGTAGITSTPISDPNSIRVEVEIGDLKKEIRQLVSEVVARSAEAEKLGATIEQLKARLAELERKEDLLYLFSRVNEQAKSALSNSEELRQKFESNELFDAYIISIDIRRSTELMLKANSADDFADFISTLCDRLRSEILNRYGVFDKFTGDGILAFFPEFFAGKDAGYLVVDAAQSCHEIFKDHYRNHRRCFTSVLLDVGLGIGIDYGQVKFVRIGGELTVVGTPVVYACRLGGAPAGSTYLNQKAGQKIFDCYSANCVIRETEHPFRSCPWCS